MISDTPCVTRHAGRGLHDAPCRMRDTHKGGFFHFKSPINPSLLTDA